MLCQNMARGFDFPKQIASRRAPKFWKFGMKMQEVSQIPRVTSILGELPVDMFLLGGLLRIVSQEAASWFPPKGSQLHESVQPSTPIPISGLSGEIPPSKA